MSGRCRDAYERCTKGCVLMFGSKAPSLGILSQEWHSSGRASILNFLVWLVVDFHVRDSSELFQQVSSLVAGSSLISFTLITAIKHQFSILEISLSDALEVFLFLWPLSFNTHLIQEKFCFCSCQRLFALSFRFLRFPYADRMKGDQVSLEHALLLNDSSWLSMKPSRPQGHAVESCAGE